MSESLQAFREKSPELLATEMVGFPAGTLEALLLFHEKPSEENLRVVMPGFIAFHLPAGTDLPPDPIKDELQLVQDFGLDSLALSEMAFKMEDVFGFRVETHEVFGIVTFGELVAFLVEKLELS